MLKKKQKSKPPIIIRKGVRVSQEELEKEKLQKEYEEVKKRRNLLKKKLDALKKQFTSLGPRLKIRALSINKNGSLSKSFVEKAATANSLLNPPQLVESSFLNLAGQRKIARRVERLKSRYAKLEARVKELETELGLKKKAKPTRNVKDPQEILVNMILENLDII